MTITSENRPAAPGLGELETDVVQGDRAHQAMRVLFFLRKLDANDGIMSYCQTLAAGLGSQAVPVDMVCGGVNFEGPEGKSWAALTGVLRSWKVIGRLRKVPGPQSLFELMRLIRTQQITVINVHGLGMLAWGKVLSVATGRPMVATYHPSIHGSVDQLLTLASQPLSLCKKLALRMFAPDRIIVLSDETATYLASQCPAIADRIVKINGAVDDAYFRPPDEEERRAARAKLGLDDDEIAIVHIGRLSWNKGQDLLIEAVRRLGSSPDAPRLRCFFLGSGGDEEAMKAQAFQDEAGLRTFTFLGFIKDFQEILWAADIFALPSRFEGFGLAVVEAMCAGVVPIRTPSGGVADQILDGETGIIVPFDDVDALSGAISRLCDEATRMRMRRRALDFARERFTQGGMARRVIASYGAVGG